MKERHQVERWTGPQGSELLDLSPRSPCPRDPLFLCDTLCQKEQKRSEASGPCEGAKGIPETMTLMWLLSQVAALRVELAAAEQPKIDPCEGK